MIKAIKSTNSTKVYETSHRCGYDFDFSQLKFNDWDDSLEELKGKKVKVTLLIEEDR